jgi:hypothetical protein
MARRVPHSGWGAAILEARIPRAVHNSPFFRLEPAEPPITASTAPHHARTHHGTDTPRHGHTTAGSAHSTGGGQSGASHIVEGSAQSWNPVHRRRYTIIHTSAWSRGRVLRRPGVAYREAELALRRRRKHPSHLLEGRRRSWKALRCGRAGGAKPSTIVAMRLTSPALRRGRKHPYDVERARQSWNPAHHRRCRRRRCTTRHTSG